MTEMFNEPIDIIENKIYTFSPSLMKILIKDNTTKGNLHWATSTYEKFGEWFRPEREMQIEQLVNANILTPRVSKSSEEQQARTKDKGEVFTPAWMCNMQVNYLDEDWFGRKNVFNKEIDNDWKTNKNKIIFSKNLKKTWQEYVSDIRLEITCGEAPYLVSRYDVVKGEVIPVENRIGVLDRKLRIINENVDDEEEWLEQAEIAFKSTYGYDYQGDNVVIARENLLYTLIDNMMFKFGHQPSVDVLKNFATIVSWNIWQMDGLDYTVPYSEIDIQKEQVQLNLFGEEPEPAKKEKQLARIKNWETNKTIEFKELLGGKNMKFDYIIGNPPYQKDLKDTSDSPIYHVFMDETYKISDKVELITPGRFLFNAGKTPKAWNQKMLSDEHLKILNYEPDCKKIFLNANFSGGVVITIRDNTKSFTPIGVFTFSDSINGILDKVKPDINAHGSLADIMTLQNRFNLEVLYCEHPEYESMIGSEGKEKRLVTSIFSTIPEFKEEKGNDNDIEILGVVNLNQRQHRWINSKYILDNGLLNKYKVVVPKAYGSGLVENTKVPLIGEPEIIGKRVGYTQSFIGISVIGSKQEADNIIKYLKSKFCRICLAILKITQDNSPEKWKYVPIQDFSNNSDIDWSKSIKDIDNQLYTKYGLTKDEIIYIESHVKEMQ